jgi:hypothetical protein
LNVPAGPLKEISDAVLTSPSSGCRAPEAGGPGAACDDRYLSITGDY